MRKGALSAPLAGILSANDGMAYGEKRHKPSVKILSILV